MGAVRFRLVGVLHSHHELGRTFRAVAIETYQPHGGWLCRGCDRLSARNSSITRTARDCESGESLGRKWGRVASVRARV